jgi:hypothetical protein
MVSRPDRVPVSEPNYTDAQRAALEAARERFARYQALRNLHLERKIERTREYSKRNVEQARILRDRYNQKEH